MSSTTLMTGGELEEYVMILECPITGSLSNALHSSAKSSFRTLALISS